MPASSPLSQIGIFAQPNQQRALSIAITGKSWSGLQINNITLPVLPDNKVIKLSKITKPEHGFSEVSFANTDFIMVGVKVEKSNSPALIGKQFKYYADAIVEALKPVFHCNGRFYIVPLDENNKPVRVKIDENKLAKILHEHDENYQAVTELKMYRPNHIEDSFESALLGGIAAMGNTGFNLQTDITNSGSQSPRSADSSGRGSIDSRDSRRNSATADSPGDFGRAGRITL